MTKTSRPKKKSITQPLHPIAQASALWRVLNEDGRLSPKTHDETFINQLRKTLLIPDGEDVATFLSRGTTDTTTLLVAILTSLEPFGWMLRDIYDLFVRHGVNASDEQLRAASIRLLRLPRSQWLGLGRGKPGPWSQRSVEIQGLV
jgi:hypothetical protein